MLRPPNPRPGKERLERIVAGPGRSASAEPPADLLVGDMRRGSGRRASAWARIRSSVEGAEPGVDPGRRILDPQDFGGDVDDATRVGHVVRRVEDAARVQARRRRRRSANWLFAPPATAATRIFGMVAAFRIAPIAQGARMSASTRGIRRVPR